MFTVRLVHAAARPEKAGRLFEGGKWLFLGQDYLRLKDWEKGLGPGFSRMDISRLLDETADEIRHPFVKRVDALSRRFGKDPDWWLTPIANRNPVESRLFLHVVYLWLVRKIMKEKTEMPLLIVGESYGLIEGLSRLLKSYGFDVHVIGRYKKRLAFFLTPAILPLYWAWFLMNSFFRHRAAKKTRPEGFQRKFLPGKKPLILIGTYVYPSQYLSGGAFSDRHFPHLYEWLYKKGYDIAVLPSLCGLRKIAHLDSPGELVSVYKWMRESSTNFIIPEDWIKVRDYLEALWCSIKTVYFSGRVNDFSGIDISPIPREERWMPVRMNAKLYYILPRRLKEAGCSPAGVIGWFENQDIDKALNMGYRRAFPGVKVLGAELLIFFPNFINLFPTKAEADFGVLPHVLLGGGLHSRKVLGSYFDAGISYRIGPALRYSYLWNEKIETRMEQRTVAVPLPSRLAESVELLEQILPVAKMREDIQHWHIKVHPDYSLMELKAAFGEGRWPDGLEVWSGTMEDLLRASSVVISLGSGAALESAAMGIPVIMVGRQSALNYDPLRWFEGHWKMCHTQEEITDALDDYLNIGEAERQSMEAMAEELKRQCFEPVSGDAMNIFIEGLK